jgi:hypothetical protein
MSCVESPWTQEGSGARLILFFGYSKIIHHHHQISRIESVDCPLGVDGIVPNNANNQMIQKTMLQLAIIQRSCLDFCSAHFESSAFRVASI